MSGDYVHGYSPRESGRLVDQATPLAELLHGGTRYPAGSRELERTAEPDGVFCYTFFKAVAVQPVAP